MSNGLKNDFGVKSHPENGAVHGKSDSSHQNTITSVTGKLGRYLKFPKFGGHGVQPADGDPLTKIPQNGSLTTLENGESNGVPSFFKFIKGKDPTLTDIINYEETYKKTDDEITHTQRKASEDLENSDGSKFDGFGWVTGVLIRCMLCIFGATLFLRMSWTAGQAGVLLGMAVVLLSLVVAGITAISMSAIATNGEVRNGGLYYLVSRSLGPEFGGSIGIIFYVANIVNASMNCVGLAETIRDILKEHNIQLIDGLTNGALWDVRVYGLAVCIILQAIIFIGTEFEAKTQMLLLVTIITSIASHIVGSFLPSNDYKLKQGIVGYSARVFWENMTPDFRSGDSFITVFGVYFPAMTGIMGGANMSGDLKDPSKSIPKGTLWAILVTTCTYAMSMLITAATTIRDTDGINLPIYNTSTHEWMKPVCYANRSCPGGLANDYNIVSYQGAWSPLVIAGIIATTLSSASGCLIGAPRVFQALCEDKIYPYISYFAKGHGKNNDPFRAYFLTCFIACAVIMIGELNAIAMIITNFFLAAFAITNFACFDASAARSPGFRPGFRWYNKYLSLFGSMLCIVLMFVFSWIVALGTFIIFAILFLYIKHNKANINWGSSTEANRYRKALVGVLKLTRSAEHVKNYRPQVLVLTGNPAARQVLVDFAYCITKGTSLMMCGHIIPYSSTVSATSCIRKLNDRFADWFQEHKVKAFYCAVAQRNLRIGVQSLLQTVGLGKMTPNILMLGYKDKWLEKLRQDKKEELEDYLGVINDAFESNLSICIFRNENEGLDHSALLSSEMDRMFLKLPDLMLSDKTSALADDLSSGLVPKSVRPKASTAGRKIDQRKSLKNQRNIKSEKNLSTALGHAFNASTAPIQRSRSENFLICNQPVIKRNMKFRSRIRDGLVDVWWLFDDGGLTLLLSYLLTSHPSFVEDAKLRVFTICPPQVAPETVQENLEKMLKKFRINFKQVTVIVDVEREIYPETQEEYNEMIEALNPEDSEPHIPKNHLESYSSRTNKILLQREYLLEHSSASNLVIITLPLAPSNVVMSPLYTLWLDMLSRDMPPTLFVRGNHTSVLTFYS